MIKIIEIGLHTQFIGEIMDVKSDDSVLDNNLPSIAKVNPIIFSASSATYHRVGRRIGKAFSIGKKIGEVKKIRA